MAPGVRVAVTFVVVWTWLVPASAEIPPELVGEQIVDVQIIGEESDHASARALGIPLGARLTRRVVRHAIFRLLESGEWGDVEIEVEPAPGGVRVLARLTPRIFLTRVEVLGNDRFDDDELLRALELSDGQELRPRAEANWEARLRALYAADGYEQPALRFELRETDDPSRRVLRIHIEEGQATEIVAITFVGEQPTRRMRAHAHLDFEPGDTLDRSEILLGTQQLQAALREQGYLQAVIAEPHYERRDRGVEVQLRTYIGLRYEVRIRGNGRIPRSEIRESLDLGQDQLSPAVLEGMRLRVVELCQKYGFHYASAEVIHRTPAPREEDDEPIAYLDVDIELDEALVIREIRFPGAQHHSSDYLLEQVITYLQEDLPVPEPFGGVVSHTADQLFAQAQERARTGLPPLVSDPAHIYYEPTYAEAVEHIGELYRSQGFLSVQVGPAELQLTERYRGVVEIPIREGPQSRLHSVVIAGNSALTSRQILVAAELEQGEPFSHLELERAKLSIQELYREEGYLFARVIPSTRYSDDRTQVEVTFEIVERFVVHVGEIIVRGNDRTRDSLILDLVRLRPGDVYRPSLARQSQERLMELGVLSSATVGPEDPDLPARLKNLVVTVSERSTQYLDFQAGVSTGQGVRGAMAYGYRNLGGYAVGFSFRLELAQQFFFLEDVLEERYGDLSLADRLERNVTASLSIPHIPRLPRLHTSLDLVHLRDNQRDFGLDKNSLALTFTLRPVRRLTLSLSEGLENNDVQLLVDDTYEELLATTTDPRLQRLLRVPEGRSTLVATRADITVDFRDNPFVPTRGFFGAFSFEWARTISTETMQDAAGEEESFFSNHLRFDLTASGYIPVNERVVLATQIRFGRIVHLTDGSQTYPNRRFFLGGVDTLRGFLLDALIPQDVADAIVANEEFSPNEAFRGGDVYILARAELRVRLYGALHAGLFCDAGNLWADPAGFDPFDLRPAAGLGLRFATPVGPIALDYGINVLRRTELDEAFGAFHFSIGLF